MNPQNPQTRLIASSKPEASVVTPTENDPGQPKASHFVVPTRIDPAKRKSLLQLLKQERLGDESGRRLFVAALEYEIGRFQQLYPELPQGSPPVPASPPQVRNPELLKLGAAVEVMLHQLEETWGLASEALLEALDRTDTFARRHDPAYITILQCELRRLVTACHYELPVPTIQIPNRVVEASRHLIAMLGHIFTECFDANPTAGKGEPFHHVVNGVISILGLPAQCDEEFLKTLLNS